MSWSRRLIKHREREMLVKRKKKRKSSSWADDLRWLYQNSSSLIIKQTNAFVSLPQFFIMISPSFDSHSPARYQVESMATIHSIESVSYSASLVHTLLSQTPTHSFQPAKAKHLLWLNTCSSLRLQRSTKQTKTIHWSYSQLVRPNKANKQQLHVVE